MAEHDSDDWRTPFAAVSTGLRDAREFWAGELLGSAEVLVAARTSRTVPARTRRLHCLSQTSHIWPIAITETTERRSLHAN